MEALASPFLSDNQDVNSPQPHHHTTDVRCYRKPRTMGLKWPCALLSHRGLQAQVKRCLLEVNHLKFSPTTKNTNINCQGLRDCCCCPLPPPFPPSSNLPPFKVLFLPLLPFPLHLLLILRICLNQGTWNQAKWRWGFLLSGKFALIPAPQCCAHVPMVMFEQRLASQRSWPS